MYFKKFPVLLQQVYSNYLWKVDTSAKIVYLTFDDGPTSMITDECLEMLTDARAKATFFVLGKNVQTYPHITHRTIDAGHSIGNHGYAHLNGWKSQHYTYLKDFSKAQQMILEYTGYRTELFRPAYGRVTHKQARNIMRSHQIVMMDVMGGDFDTKISATEVIENVLKNVEPGSIICLHDSLKAWPRLKEALPIILNSLAEDGYRFEALNPTPLREQAIH